MKKPSEVNPARLTARRKSKKAASLNSKHQGELAELAFVYKAASLGFGVAKPYGESERFDFIVSSGRRLWRVQVKSTYTVRQRGYRIHAYGNKNHGVTLYTKDEIDLLVVYLVPENSWYVIPIGAVGRRHSLYFYPKATFYPNGNQRGLRRYEKYREAWELMSTPSRTSD